MRAARATGVAVALLAAGCGGSSDSQSTSDGAATQQGKVIGRSCTAASGGFRACTVFHRGGEVTRIERRAGSGWSVLLAPGRAPYPGHGWWRRVFADPHGQTLLAEWSGECEIPFTYLITTHTPTLRQVFRPQPADALGWTSDGLARVKLLQPLPATKTRARLSSGIYRVTPRGSVARLERRLPPSRGC